MSLTTNRREVLALASLAMAGLAGCLGAGSSDSDDAEDTDTYPGMQVLSSDVERAAPDVAPADLEALVRGNNAFALEVLQELAGEDENVFVSPFSISLALAMTWAGARGQTETEMADALTFPDDLDQETLHPAFNALWRRLEESDEGESQESQDGESDETEFTLSIANAIWGQAEYSFEDAFLETLAHNYGAGLRTLDFAEEPEPAREVINDWVEAETDEKIEELLPKGAITTDTRLVLTNAIYFLANWDHQFDEGETTQEPFTALDGREEDVPMMHQNLRTNYGEVDDTQVVKLPYAGTDTSMIVVVPAEGEFESVRDDLDAEGFEELLEATGDASVDLAFPRFEFESSTSLKETLSALGMPGAFQNGADFTGMTNEERLLIDDVYHDAYVAVDENGTEAAAATGAVMIPTSAPAESAEMTVDRPFCFAIRADETGSLLFLGQVVDAAAAQ